MQSSYLKLTAFAFLRTDGAGFLRGPHTVVTLASGVADASEAVVAAASIPVVLKVVTEFIGCGEDTFAMDAGLRSCGEDLLRSLVLLLDSLDATIIRSPHSPGVVALRCLCVAVAARVAGVDHVKSEGTRGAFFADVKRMLATHGDTTLRQVLKSVRVIGTGPDRVVSPITLQCFDVALRALVPVLDSYARMGFGFAEDRADTIVHDFMCIIACAGCAGACCGPLAATFLRGGGGPDPCNCLGLVRVAEQGSIVAPRHVVDPDTLRRWTVAVLGAVVERKDDLLPYQLWFSDVMKMLSHPCLVQGKDMAKAWASVLAIRQYSYDCHFIHPFMGGVVDRYRLQAAKPRSFVFKASYLGSVGFAWEVARGMLPDVEWSTLQQDVFGDLERILASCRREEVDVTEGMYKSVVAFMASWDACKDMLDRHLTRVADARAMKSRAAGVDGGGVVHPGDDMAPMKRQRVVA